MSFELNRLITGGTNFSLVEQNHNRVKVSLAQEVSQEFYCFPECIINEKRCVSTIRGGYEERSAAVSCCIQRWQELYHSCEQRGATELDYVYVLSQDRLASFNKKNSKRVEKNSECFPDTCLCLFPRSLKRKKLDILYLRPNIFGVWWREAISFPQYWYIVRAR